jgi:RimJ/RimL family protein N-acetyltransferase/catechol 2,3-dioxygenase-like lactoylglutathione lyase family enzyme
MTLRLTLPDAGITDGTVLLRMPVVDDVDALMPSFADPELREAGNLPDFDRPQMLAMLPQLPALAASGRLLPLIAIDPRSGDCVGGGTLHHLDAERSIIEIGYWVLPAARRRGHATRIARLLAEHAFSLGVIRVAAYVNVGNVASERVLERAGFAREGVVRSMPVPSGARIDKTLFSCLDSARDDEKAFTRQRHRSMGDNMSSVDEQSANATGSPPVNPGEMRLEVVVVPVSDVDRAKAFYESLGWRLDADLAVDDGYRVVQLTPPGSGCSIIFGTGVTAAAPGSFEGLQLSVYDIDAARADLVARGIDVSDPFHDVTGIFHHAGTGGRADGAAPEHADYGSFVAFSDPDGNGWLLQEIKTRLPGR